MAAFGKNFFLAFGKAYYRQFVQPQPADNLQCAAQLPFAAVNNNQTRQIFIILIAAVHNLLHGFKIIRLAFGANNFIFAVIFFARFSVAEHNHGCNRFRTLRMRNIKAVHAFQRVRQVQRPLQFFRSFFVCFQADFTFAQAFFQKLARIFISQLQKVALGSSLRADKFNLVPGFFRQPGSKHRSFIFFRQIRQNYLTRYKRSIIVILLDKRRYHFLPAVAAVGQKEILTPNQLATAHKKYLQADAGIVFGITDYIHITAAGNCLLRFIQTFYSRQLVAQARRFFKSITFGSVLHALL